jgi:hypothetical protein
VSQRLQDVSKGLCEEAVSIAEYDSHERRRRRAAATSQPANGRDILASHLMDRPFLVLLDWTPGGSCPLAIGLECDARTASVTLGYPPRHTVWCPAGRLPLATVPAVARAVVVNGQPRHPQHGRLIMQMQHRAPPEAHESWPPTPA